MHPLTQKIIQVIDRAHELHQASWDPDTEIYLKEEESCFEEAIQETDLPFELWYPLFSAEPDDLRAWADWMKTHETMEGFFFDLDPKDLGEEIVKAEET